MTLDLNIALGVLAYVTIGLIAALCIGRVWPRNETAEKVAILCPLMWPLVLAFCVLGPFVYALVWLTEKAYKFGSGGN